MLGRARLQTNAPLETGGLANTSGAGDTCVGLALVKKDIQLTCWEEPGDRQMRRMLRWRQEVWRVNVALVTLVQGWRLLKRKFS